LMKLHLRFHCGHLREIGRSFLGRGVVWWLHHAADMPCPQCGPEEYVDLPAEREDLRGKMRWIRNLQR
jgi:hypothetical protein